MKVKIFVFLCSVHFTQQLQNYEEIINYNKTSSRTISEKGSLFGYSIWLQKGYPHSRIIVGAPKMKTNNNAKTGALFECMLNSNECRQIQFINKKRINAVNSTGDFLGINLSGGNYTSDHLYACAPRTITKDDSRNYFTKGYCLNITNQSIESFEPLKDFYDLGSSFYDAGFAECGFDIKYITEAEALLLGAPGKTAAIGAIAKIDNNSVSFAGEKFSIFKPHIDSYMGYAVSYGKFLANSSRIFYVAGAPRYYHLHGKVMIYTPMNKRFELSSELHGDELGAYFGSSLLTISRDDRGDDLLVGAPMAAGKTWDEGCVFFYKNKQDVYFDAPVKIEVNQPGARFGTVMSQLGDLDLDGHQDIAIAAPYENDGEGAVYLFLNTHNLATLKTYQKIRPSRFSLHIPTPVKYFGFGISNGVDLENTKHNSFAIGAYGSDQIFIFQSHEISDCYGTINTNISTLYRSTTHFKIDYCIRCEPRNGQRNTLSNIHTKLALFNPSTDTNYTVHHLSYNCNSFTDYCESYVQELRVNTANLTPFRIDILYAESTSDLYRVLATKSLPITRECVSGPFCLIDLSIETFAKTKLVHGLDNELEIIVKINNLEMLTTYNVELHIEIVTPMITLNSVKKCEQNQTNYNCLFAQNFMAEKIVERNFLFDLSNVADYEEQIKIRFFVNSTDIDKNLANNRKTVVIPIESISAPFVYAQSEPQALQFEKGAMSTVVLQLFKIGNEGPSALVVDLKILVPQLTYADVDILQIQEVENTHGVTCKQQPRTVFFGNLSISSKADGLVISCDQVNCIEFKCKGGFLPKTNQPITFTLKIDVRMDYLSKLFPYRDVIIFASTAIMEDKDIHFSALTMFYGLISTTIPLWVYCAAIGGGFFLLIITVFVLYKCNFFKRTYSEKLKDESNFCEMQNLSSK